MEQLKRFPQELRPKPCFHHKSVTAFLEDGTGFYTRVAPAGSGDQATITHTHGLFCDTRNERETLLLGGMKQPRESAKLLWARGWGHSAPGSGS